VSAPKTYLPRRKQRVEPQVFPKREIKTAREKGSTVDPQANSKTVCGRRRTEKRGKRRRKTRERVERGSPRRERKTLERDEGLCKESPSCISELCVSS